MVRRIIYDNISELQAAVSTNSLFTAETARKHVGEGLRLQGIAAPTPRTFTLVGDGSENTTTMSASIGDVMGQLRLHLLQPTHPSPPLVNPAFVHIFSGQGGPSIDNMANSPAGRELEAYLQSAQARPHAARL